MARVVLAACAALFAAGFTSAADFKPLWEIEVANGNKATSPGWLSFSPDGKAVVAVVVHEGGNPRQYSYNLRIWDAASRKQRLTTDLGTGKVPSWGDPLADFPTDESVMTGGHALITRNLTSGSQLDTRYTGGMSDHAVWAVPDLRESFYLRRDPDRHGMPLELFIAQPSTSSMNSAGGGRFKMACRRTEIQPPRPGLRAECVALNPARTRVAVSFRDEASTSSQRHHALVLYSILTVDDFRLEPLTTIDNPHPGPVTAVAFAPNGRILATGGDDGSISLWDLTRPGPGVKPMATVDGVSNYRVFALAFRPDSRVLAAITWDKTKPNLLLIDVDTGKLVDSLRLERELTALAWSPDGRTLLTGGASGKIQAWDADALLKGD